MKRKCYFCQEEFEDFGRLEPDNKLVFCSESCKAEKYGDHEGERFNIDDDLYLFNLRQHGL